MPRLTICRKATVLDLFGTLDRRIDWYFDLHRNEWPAELLNPDGLLEERREIPSFWDELVEPDPKASASVRSQTDRPNVLTVYRALNDLTPVHAADGRIWTYLCHTHCARYVKFRWMSHRPADSAKAVNLAVNHFFTSDSRSFMRGNGISRLWWIGHVANRIEPGDEEQFLQVVLHTQEVRQQLLERPSLTMNPYLLGQIYRVIREFWSGPGQGEQLLRRETFREWMRRLNGRGGMVLLDGMDEASLRQLLRDEAERALQTTT